MFDLTFWSCSKILLFFHHGEHGGHGEVFEVHATVFCGSWLNLVFRQNYRINKMAGSLRRRMPMCGDVVDFRLCNAPDP